MISRIHRVRCLVIALMALLVWASATVVLADDPGRIDWPKLLDEVHPLYQPAERITAISTRFLGTPYRANTLIGGPGETEQLVVNASEVDCLTFLDLVEALRRSQSAEDFVTHLKQVRYVDGEVAYRQRRHFFSDWVSAEQGPVSDVTMDIGGVATQSRIKALNRREDGSLWLAGLPVTTRRIAFIPAPQIDETVLSALKSGDYAGIYTDQPGLDVTHTGIIVRQEGRVLLRHASSRKTVASVVDEPLVDYLRDKPGLVVYRVR